MMTNIVQDKKVGKKGSLKTPLDGDEALKLEIRSSNDETIKKENDPLASPQDGAMIILEMKPQ